jgi:hypothetical protein
MPNSSIVIGIISDTHGLLRPEAIKALQGSSLIIHAGDIGKESIIPELESIAPVYAVRGNVDHSPWAFRYPLTQVVETHGIFIYVHHGHLELDLDLQAAGFHILISGHTHEPLVEHKNGILYVNPGSAGPKRFHLPVSLASLNIQHGNFNAKIISLPI